MSEIQLSTVQILDVFFRFTAVGVLLSLFISKITNIDRWTSGLIFCSMAYLLLTAPIENHHYGWLRPPLLLFTDLTPFALLGLYWIQVHSASILSRLSLMQKILLSAWLLWTIYFFIIEQGQGLYHDLNHVLGFLILVFLVIDGIRGLNDDLVATRRRWRIGTIAGISAYMATLTLIELAFTHLKDHWLFSLLNSLLACSVALLIFYRSIKLPHLSLDNSPQHRRTSPHPQESHQLQSENSILIRLNSAMNNGIYKQNGLTIGKLASELNIPAHQLRATINKDLNFNNFSTYLNSYRIKAVCQALENPDLKTTPILTIALNAGYNSIAPFNRAFKEIKGITPTEYRDQFQKR